MSGMVAQITQGQEMFDMVSIQHETESTEPETFDDIFDTFKYQVYDTSSFKNT